MKITLKGRWMVTAACAAIAGVVFFGNPIISYAYTQATGIVSADAANVRKEPNTGSDVVTGLLKGSTVTVTDEVTDSSGIRWYQVSVEGDTGYVRSDLLIKSTTTTGATANITTEIETPAVKPIAATVTAIAETKAYVSTNSAIVREGASKDHEIAGSITKNSSVTITGEAKGKDGKKWYQIKYNNANGNEAAGFVRSDLLTIGEAPAAEPAPAPAETETPVEEENLTPEGGEGEIPAEEPEVPAEPEPAPEPEVKPDYEMKFEPNAEGVNEWWLYDNINNSRQALANLKEAAAAGVEGSEADAKMISTQKIIIIVLAAIVVILIIVTTLLLFKIRDLYDDGDEYDEEDDEEDDDEEEEDEDDDEEDEEPVKKKAITPFKQAKNKTQKEVQKKAEVRKMPVKEAPVEEEEEEEEAPVVKKAAPAKKAKNFLIDDDEFEFEFLNMDDRE